MKILKVKIKRTQTDEGTHYDYPAEYDPKKITVMCYESLLEENYNKVVQRGNKEEYCIGYVKNEDAAAFLASDDIEEITKAQAKELGGSWTKQEEKIRDIKEVEKVLSKLAKKEKLTAKEEKVIDPEDVTLGFNKTKAIEEVIDEIDDNA